MFRSSPNSARIPRRATKREALRAAGRRQRSFENRLTQVKRTLISTATLPAFVPEPARSSLAAATDAWCALRGPRLHSLVLFGSVARGRSTARSDIDLLVIADSFPRSLHERRRPLLAAWSHVRARQGLPAVE